MRVLADPFGQVVVLQVEDTGPGIPEAERELVFQPFYRALGTDVDGSGLGLAIVQEIAHQHHAELTIEDAAPARRRGGAGHRLRGDDHRAIPAEGAPRGATAPPAPRTRRRPRLRRAEPRRR